MARLEGKTILITGANGGLGTCVTNAFLNAGARVIGVSRVIADTDFPHENFSALAAELSNDDAARHVIETAVQRLGRLDALVHLVGGFAGGHSLAETDDATFDRMLDINLRSAFHVLRAVIPIMRSQNAGRILAIGSKAATEPAPLAGAYAASKAALVSLIGTVARENADRRISANVVLPGTMDTPANRAAQPDADFSKWIQPCQVAKLLVHLATDDSSQINGAIIPVFGAEV